MLGYLYITYSALDRTLRINTPVRRLLKVNERKTLVWFIHSFTPVEFNTSTFSKIELRTL